MDTQHRIQTFGLISPGEAAHMIVTLKKNLETRRQVLTDVSSLFAANPESSTILIEEGIVSVLVEITLTSEAPLNEVAAALLTVLTRRYYSGPSPQIMGDLKLTPRILIECAFYLTHSSLPCIRTRGIEMLSQLVALCPECHKSITALPDVTNAAKILKDKPIKDSCVASSSSSPSSAALPVTLCFQLRLIDLLRDLIAVGIELENEVALAKEAADLACGPTGKMRDAALLLLTDLGQSLAGRGKKHHPMDEVLKGFTGFNSYLKLTKRSVPAEPVRWEAPAPDWPVRVLEGGKALEWIRQGIFTVLSQDDIKEGIWQYVIRISGPGSNWAYGIASSETTGIPSTQRSKFLDWMPGGCEINMSGVMWYKGGQRGGSNPSPKKDTDLKIEVDMEKKRCYFFTNGVMCPGYYANIPNSVRIAVSGGEIGFTATLVSKERIDKSEFQSVPGLKEVNL